MKHYDSIKVANYCVVAPGPISAFHLQVHIIIIFFFAGLQLEMWVSGTKSVVFPRVNLEKKNDFLPKCFIFGQRE